MTLPSSLWRDEWLREVGRKWFAWFPAKDYALCRELNLFNAQIKRKTLIHANSKSGCSVHPVVQAVIRMFSCWYICFPSGLVSPNREDVPIILSKKASNSTPVKPLEGISLWHHLWPCLNIHMPRRCISRAIVSTMCPSLMSGKCPSDRNLHTSWCWRR